MAGKWKRRYFKTKAEAVAYAAEQNGNSLNEQKGHSKALFHPRFDTFRVPNIRRYLGGAWSMHLPFAYDLMRELRPSVFVELGVYQGESYFTFCQSVEENGLATQCYGIDTWRGDIHTGFYGPEIGREVAEYNRRYSSFSHLIALTFKEALSHFAEGAIDLLHIDGAHRFEDVKNDFESWRPKLSRRGIILFHDVEVRGGGFAVYRLWEEIARPRASFVFEFGYGLGVWKQTPVSKSDSPFLRKLFLADSKEKRAIISYYTRMAAEVESLAKPQPNKPEDRESSTHLQSFASREGAVCEEYSSRTEIAPGRWCRLKMGQPWGLGDGSAPVRFDPVDRPGVVDIAAVSIRSSATGEVLWRANTRSGLEALAVRGTALRLPHARVLRLLAYGDDPQVYLPHLTGEVFQDPLSLEILLRFDAAPDSIAALGQLPVEIDQVRSEFALAWALLSYIDSTGYLTLALQPTVALREEARQAAEMAVTLQPNLGEAILAKGLYHYACLRDYDTAAHYFEQARQFLPNSSRISESLAYVERRRGNSERSESYFNEAERLDPRNVNILTQHALSYIYLRRFPEALRKLDQVLNITPDDVDTLAQKAAIAQAEGDLPRAAALLAPLRPAADLTGALETQVYQGILERRPAPIIPRLKEILANPDPALGFINGELRFYLGWAQEVAGDRAAAQESWRQARSELESFLKEQPGNYSLMDDLALTNMGLGDKTAAFAFVDRATAVLPIEKDAATGPVSTEILARVSAQMGESDGAIAALQKLLSIPYGGGLAENVPLTPALLRLDPMFDPLRNDPRFQKLCEEKQP